MPKRITFAGTLALFAACSAVLNAAGQATYNTNAPFLPDPRISPGDALPVTARDICLPGYSKKVRDVPQSVKEQAYREYGIVHRQRGEFEVDHLISLEIGGSNSVRNLWPQSYKTKPWNAHVKDRLENAFHKDVCSGRIELADAQKQIASNWIDAYKRRFPDDPLARIPTPPYGRATAAAAARPGARRLPTVGWFARRKGGRATSATTSAGPVWVNTKSGVYWRPGTRYYGKTKQGRYMNESEAVKAGFHAAKGR